MDATAGGASASGGAVLARTRAALAACSGGNVSAGPDAIDTGAPATGDDATGTGATGGGAAQASAVDTARLRLALDLAACGPPADANPRVGCVLADGSGAVVATGFHRGAGTAHAEVAALAAARAGGAAVAGGTAYVTLEPCNHAGRTGPCVEALREGGIARLVYGQADPGRASSGGAAALKAAGVVVAGGLLAAEAQALNREWTFAIRAGRPFVTWKTAMSLDGRVAAADGTSRWITSPPARADVHALRARCGAILVGTGTALADDPRLTVRGPGGEATGRQPLRVVMGRRPLPAGARLCDDTASTLALATHDPAAVLAALTDREVRHVLLEGGPTVAAAFLGAGLVDEIVAYVAPALLGAGPAAVGDLGVTTITGARRFITRDVARVGPDVRITLGSPRTDPQIDPQEV